MNLLKAAFDNQMALYKSQNPPTFAERVKGKEKSSLKRPNCLRFKTKANLKRHEVIDLLKEMKFECEKLEGVGA